MTQNVLQIPTAAPLSGMALVTDVNNALAGLASLCSGGAAPSASSLGLASLAGLLWHDTQANQLKLRNQADSAWIVLGSVNETSGVFVPAAAQVYSPLSAATTLALANAGQFLLCSAALTLTLPASSGLTSAWSVSIFAKGGPVSLTLANSSDVLNGSVGGSVIIPKGYFAEIVTDAAGNYTAVVIPASLGITVLASAATVDLGTATSQVVSISGTTSITSFGSSAPAGTVYTLQFSASLTLTYNAASLILPGAASLTTAANDCAQVLSLGSGNWICIDYQRANGQPVVGTSGSSPAVRQTALTGVTNSSGQAAFINSGSALRPGLSATSATLLLAFAAGYGSGGAIDYVEQIAADSATFFPTLTANVLSYLTATRVSAGNVTGGATLAPVQYGPSYNKGQQALLQLNNNVLDDNSNSWAWAGTPSYSNAAPKISGTYYAAFNGINQGVSTTNVSSISSFGNGGWTLEAWVNMAATGTVLAPIFAAVNASGYGLIVDAVASSNYLEVRVSSSGSSSDILNTTSTVPLPTGSWHHVALVYDPITGYIYLYLDGVNVPSAGGYASGKSVCAVTSMFVGGGNCLGTSRYFNGSVQAFSFRPYCAYPAGSTFTPFTTAPSISAAGYASDWFDTVNMVMKSPSAASSVAGNNPTFATSNKLYLGEVIAGASSISSVVSYAFQGQYLGAWTNGVSASTSLTAATNLGTSLQTPDVEWMCIAADPTGFAVGDIVQAIYFGSDIGGALFNIPIWSTRNAAGFIVYSNIQVMHKTAATQQTLSLASWAWRIKTKRSF